MPTIRAKAKNGALDCEGECVTIAAADLDYFIENILNASRLIHYNLATEHSITQTKLSLTIVSKGVQLTSFCDNGRAQVAALNFWNWVRGLKVK